jgi:hypothetical protein
VIAEAYAAEARQIIRECCVRYTAEVPYRRRPSVFFLLVLLDYLFTHYVDERDAIGVQPAPEIRLLRVRDASRDRQRKD